jgi:hypothetical protein
LVDVFIFMLPFFTLVVSPSSIVEDIVITSSSELHHQLDVFRCLPEILGWRLLRRESNQSKTTAGWSGDGDGRWRWEDGRWRWKMEDGRWKMEMEMERQTRDRKTGD